MTDRVRALVPYAHVASVADSIDFYSKLGFEVRNRVGGANEPLDWAWLQSGDAALMIARASEPIDRERQAIFFYVYCDDTAAMRALLIADGVRCGDIATPFWAPRGEFRVEDPDGYMIMISHTP